MFVHDTFTGSGNVDAHTGEVGAIWTLNPSFGPGTSGELILSGGFLRRPTFGADPSNSTGEALAYVSGTVSGEFYIEAIAKFANLCRGILYFSALTKLDWEANCDTQRTDSNVHLRTGDWYRKRLRQNFSEAGAGFWLRKGAPLTLWELESV